MLGIMADRNSYTPLGDQLHSPLTEPNLSPPFPSEYETRRGASTWQRLRRWWADNVKVPWLLAQQEASPPPSGYLTLIPLSDSRLQPRSTRFSALFLLAFALTVAGSVFLLVPRLVQVAEVSVRADQLSWNMTKSTYQLKLRVNLPVYNPNYFRASVEGDLHVLFYGERAGSSHVGPASLPARAHPKVVAVKVDASDVPSDYIISILTQCSTFPEVLIFFLKGELTASVFWTRQELPTIDTYFLIDCKKTYVWPEAAGEGEPPELIELIGGPEGGLGIQQGPAAALSAQLAPGSTARDAGAPAAGAVGAAGGAAGQAAAAAAAAAGAAAGQGPRREEGPRRPGVEAGLAGPEQAGQQGQEGSYRQGQGVQTEQQLLRQPLARVEW